MGQAWLFWNTALLAAAAYCAVRAVVDFRQRRYAWAALGIASAAVILLVPIPTHAVKVTLPVSEPR